MEVRSRRHSRTAEVPVIVDPKESAAAVGLRYVSDEEPGLRRIKSGKNFRYLNVKGKPLQDENHLRRIKSLVIPPAWTDVWICPIENGHLQATGFDARGRKQYRYHPRWREIRDDTKFNRMILFGKTLPKIRARVEKDLALRGLPRRKVLATVVRLLETTFIRVGNDEYARENKSFGLTTLRDQHAEVNGSKIRFRFRGKRAKPFTIDVHDPQLARIVKKCQDLPGQELFQYIDRHGRQQDVKSEDVNEYLREISGQDFTAKDFRTWAGTVLAAEELCDGDPGHSKTRAKKFLTQAVQNVANRLGNTPAICRKCYVHPAIFDAFNNGGLAGLVNRREEELKSKAGKLSSEEQCVLRLLERHLEEKSEPLASKLRRSLSAVKKSGR